MYIVFLLVVAGVASVFSAAGDGSSSSHSSSKNPWSKDYVAPKTSPSAVRGSSAGSANYGYVNKRTGEPATEDELRDEAYRRKVIHEAREEYETQNGTVDTSGL